jgi:hypothetical protein
MNVVTSPGIKKKNTCRQGLPTIKIKTRLNFKTVVYCIYKRTADKPEDLKGKV